MKWVVSGPNLGRFGPRRGRRRGRQRVPHAGGQESTSRVGPGHERHQGTTKTPVVRHRRGGQGPLVGRGSFKVPLPEAQGVAALLQTMRQEAGLAV